MEVKGVILETVVVDPDEGLDHLEDLVEVDPEDPAEVDPEGRQGRLEGRQDRLEAGRQGPPVGHSNRLRPCTTPTRMECSTLHRRLGILRHSKAWHFKLITGEET